MKIKSSNKIEIYDKTCPLCQGTGETQQRRGRFSKAIREKARKLYKEGMSLRKIGKEIGVEHPQRVRSIIMAKTL
jgi:transposase-like protein